uniref:Secreted protein n=1 Tax=Knipowitschia caucasica TaxID=637954 RepID=A0AAV2L8U8_KNICA
MLLFTVPLVLLWFISADINAVVLTLLQSCAGCIVDYYLHTWHPPPASQFSCWSPAISSSCVATQGAIRWSSPDWSPWPLGRRLPQARSIYLRDKATQTQGLGHDERRRGSHKRFGSCWAKHRPVSKVCAAAAPRCKRCSRFGEIKSASRPVIGSTTISNLSLWTSQIGHSAPRMWSPNAAVARGAIDTQTPSGGGGHDREPIATGQADGPIHLTLFLTVLNDDATAGGGARCHVGSY